MSKIYFQGTFGAYSHLAALSIDSNAEVVPCKTFDDCFVQASKDTNSKIKYSIPIFPVILFDSGIIIFEFESFDAWTKQSSKVLQGTTSALVSIDKAAK